MATHKADGLYYVSRVRLERNGACYSQQMYFGELFDVGPRQKVKVTFDNVRRARQRRLNLGWLIYDMLYQNHITKREVDKFFNVADRADRSDEDVAKAFMDLLAARARREGRLP